MSATEYLWLEERVKISDAVPSGRTEWGAWPGKCLFHRGKVEGKMKEFIQEIQGCILPTEEKLLSRLEDVLCCCGNRPNQKTVVGRSYGYTAGVNLPQYAHEDRQAHLIEHFHNVFNSITSELEAGASADVEIDVRINIAKFLDEVLESHRYRVYNPSVVRLLHIIKQYLEKPLVEYTELPLADFIRLIEGPLWEECAEKLRTRFCSNIYVDFSSEVIDAGNIGIYLEGPSLHELKGVKSNLTTYIDKTINPLKEDKKKDGESETQNEEKQTTDNGENKTDDVKTKEEKGKVAEGNEEVENMAKAEETDDRTTSHCKDQSTESPGDGLEEALDPAVNDKKRDSKSVDRTVQPPEHVNKEQFTRSKSVPASSTLEVHESQTQNAKRAKYDSECSNEDILRPNPMQELTLFKETLSLVLVNRLEDNNTSVVNV